MPDDLVPELGPVDPDDLRRLPLFTGLSDDQVAALAAAGGIVPIEPGAVLFGEGQAAEAWWVLLDGTIELVRRSGREDTVVARMDVAGRWAGGFRAWDENGTYLATGRGGRPGRVFRLPAEVLRDRFAEWFPFGAHLIGGVYHTARSIESTARQRSSLITLGTLAAGLAHELNNPASAATRAADALAGASRGVMDALARLSRHDITAAQFGALDDLRGQLTPRATFTDALAKADREDDLQTWLDRRRVPQSWRLAAALAGADADPAWCDRVEAVLPGDDLHPALEWVAHTVAVERLLAEVRESTHRVSELVSAVRSYSQMDRASRQRVQVTDGLENTLVMLGHKLRDGITVVRDYADDLPAIDADPGELNQVWTNLIDNAADAMAGSGTLRVGVRAAGEQLVVEIADTGPGMPAEVADRAFEPFFTTKDIGHGTGLGLSQVYGFVKQSGGHVRIYSEVGSGTSVKLYLPRLLSDAAADVEETTVASAGGVGSETILVVEDDDDVRAYTTETLRDLGYRVLEAGHGEAGLKVLREHPEIALLFTDVGLPGGMNGRKLSEAAVAQRADLKVLFTSGYTRNAIVHDGRLDAGVELITKPFTQSVLAQKLRDILDAQAGPARILAVEDEALLQMLLTDMLEDAGFKVDIAGSATEALAKLKLIPGGVRAAVVDIGLPDRRGDMLVQELRALHPSLPVVVASGRAAADLKARFSGETRIEVIGKPYSAGDLVAALEAVGVKAVASP